MRKRILSVLAVSAIALAGAVAPAAVATAVVVPTVSVTVQLTTPKHTNLTTVDADAVIQLKSTQAEGFSEYAANSPIPELGDPSSSVTAGLATFTDVPANAHYHLYSHGGTGYTSPTVDVTTKTKNQTVKVPLRTLATISGTVTGPGGEPLANAEVAALHGTTIITAVTDVDGNYTIQGLHSDTYKVQFNAHWAAPATIVNNVANEEDTWSYNGGATSYGKAKWITVLEQGSTGAAAKSKTAVNGTVKATHIATFTVLVPAALAAPGYRVRVERASFWDSRLVNGAGDSVQIPMNAGNYKVAVEALSGGGSTDQVFFYGGDGKATVSNKHATTLVWGNTADESYTIGVPLA